MGKSRWIRLRSTSALLVGASLCVRIVEPSLASAAEPDELFPRTAACEAPSAATLVERAFAQILDLEAAILVETVTRGPGSENESRSRFWLCRRRFGPEEVRVMVATLPVEDPSAMRILEIGEGGQRRSRLFAERTSTRPATTDFLLTDPFLGTFSDRPASEIRANLSELVRDHEIISRQTVLPETEAAEGQLSEGERVERIGLQAIETRQYERVEILIAGEDPPLVLEYRYFERGEREPTRVASVPREQMVSFEGRILPGRMLYRDRVQQTETEVQLRYQTIPGDVRETLFLESTFYRAPLP